MKVRAQIGRWLGSTGLLLALAVPLSLAQNRRDQQRPAPPTGRQSQPSYSQPRSQQRQQYPSPRSQSRPAPQPQFRPAPAPRENNTYRPPSQGHHFGQWLNQHRDQPVDQQRRALQSDPHFQQLPPDRKQRFEQRLQNFNTLPPDRQQQVLRRGEVWEHLKPQQRQEFRNFATQYKGLPPERRQAVKNAIQTLRAMPPEARQRELQSGRFNQFSPQERQMLNDASTLPLAPAQPNSSQPEPPTTGPQRYVPRPPR